MNKQVEAVRPENEELAEKIISQMKAGVDRWEMPWHKGIVEAINVLTGPGFATGDWRRTQRSCTVCLRYQTCFWQGDARLWRGKSAQKPGLRPERRKIAGKTVNKVSFWP